MLNEVIIIGYLTKDPSIAKTKNNKDVATFIVAVQKAPKKKVNYIPVTAWDTNARNCHKYLFKGSKVCIKGELTTELFSLPGNPKERRSKLTLTALKVIFLSSQKDVAANCENTEVQSPSFQDVPEDDSIPLECTIYNDCPF